MKLNICGGSYRSQSPSIASEMSINLYPEHIETEGGKTRVALYPSPGLKQFTQLAANGPVRQVFAINGRLFVVIAGTLNEISIAGALTNRGAVGNDGLPMSVAGGPTQLLLIGNNIGYSYDLNTNTLTSLGTGGGANFIANPSLAAFVDGYFVALLAGNQFQISKLEDVTSWDTTQFATVQYFPDNVVSMIADHRQLWLFGPRASLAYWNSGAALFPFQPIDGAYVEYGCAAKFSPVKLDNSIFWLGADDRGQNLVVRLNGYTPQRVSDHALEYALSQYLKIDDAIGYSFQDQGHSFYHLYFPTANASWRFDVSTAKWHQVGYWNPATGAFDAHHSQVHAFCFGKHLVGDWATGNVYDMSINYLDDAGVPIRRVRRGPILSQEQKRLFLRSLQVDVEAGLGPMPPLLDGAGNPRAPQMTLRWSKDGGHTWSQGIDRDCGQAGDYRARVKWNMLGQGRSFIPEISMSDPIPWRIAEAYLEYEVGAA